jgi:hypothetical protein
VEGYEGVAVMRGYRPPTADTVRRMPNDASEASQLRSIDWMGVGPPPTAGYCSGPP